VEPVHGHGKNFILLGNAYSSSLDLNIDSSTRKSTTNKFSLEDLFDSFNKYGGTARNLLSRPREEIEWDIRFGITNCPDLGRLLQTSSGLPDDTSHALMLIYPLADGTGVLQRGKYEGRIASQHIRAIRFSTVNLRTICETKCSSSLIQLEQLLAFSSSLWGIHGLGYSTGQQNYLATIFSCQVDVYLSSHLSRLLPPQETGCV
jgi:hypothetical protein